MRAGAAELDMVLNIGWLRSGRVDEVRDDIAAVVRAATAAAAGGVAPVKVILECAYLSDAEKVAGCRAAEAAGAAFVKTSTGFATPPAGRAVGSTPADLRLMRAHTAAGVEVKASGGIRTLDALLEAVACGATRIGTTSTSAIAEEAARRDPRGEGLPAPSAASAAVAGGSGGAAASTAAAAY